MTTYSVSATADDFLPVSVMAELQEHVGEFLLIGAVALDVLAHGLAGLELGRATKDLDIAVAVSSANEYWHRVGRLRNSGGITYRFSSSTGVLVDVLPSGPIADPAGDITINDDHVNVTGMAEAFSSAELIELGEGLVIRCASLAGMVVLKLIAWRTRGSYNSDKDALDLASLLNASCSGIFEDECWNDEEALAACQYDLFATGAYRVGRAIQANFLPGTKEQVLDLLAGTRGEFLVAKLTPVLASTTDRLEALVRGLESTPPIPAADQWKRSREP